MVGSPLALGDKAAGPVLEARVFRALGKSAGDRHRGFRSAVAELVDSSRLARPAQFLVVLQVHERACAAPLAHHSRFVQLSVLLPTDPAAQEHELLCRAVEYSLTLDQLQGAELSCVELLARRPKMLEMKHRDKVAGSLLGGSIEEDSRIYLGTGAHPRSPYDDDT